MKRHTFAKDDLILEFTAHDNDINVAVVDRIDETVLTQAWLDQEETTRLLGLIKKARVDLANDKNEKRKIVDYCQHCYRVKFLNAECCSDNLE